MEALIYCILAAVGIGITIAVVFAIVTIALLALRIFIILIPYAIAIALCVALCSCGGDVLTFRTRNVTKEESEGKPVMAPNRRGAREYEGRQVIGQLQNEVVRLGYSFIER